MTNRISIAFSCNNEWIDKLAVTVISILENANKNDFYHFYILDGGISEINKIKLSKIKSKINFKLEYLKINKELFKNAPLSHHFKLETYYRLALANLISDDKLLYLDVDILVHKNISELFNIDIENYYAAAVEDILSKERKIHKLNVKKYFNAGVLLLNLKKIRDENLEKEFFDVINHHSNLITWVDQCVLNHVFKENVKFLNEKFNFQHHSSITNINNLYKKVKKDVIITHFVSTKKPWNFEKSIDLIIQYYSYLFKTPFKTDSLKTLLKNLIKKIIILYKISL